MTHVFDAHSHYWPRPMVAELRAGRAWHGWTLDETGPKPSVRRGNLVAPFKMDVFADDFAERRRHRREDRGIDTEVLIVPSFMWHYDATPADAEAVCRDINEDLAALEREYPGEVYGMGVLPLQDQAATQRTVSHAVGELGLGAFAIGTHVEGRNLDDPDVVRTLREVLDADVAITLHANYFDRMAADRLPRYYFGNAFGVPLESSVAVMSLAYSGLMDSYPMARIAATHGGGWLPYGIGRLLLRHQQGHGHGGMKESPDVYLRRFYYDCLIHDELSLEFLVRRVGADRLIIGTDYPFGGDIPGGSPAWILEQGFLTRREKMMIRSENACRFLGKEPASVAR